MSCLNLSLLVAEDIGVTSIDDGHGGASEQFTAGSTQLDLHWREKSKPTELPSKAWKWLLLWVRLMGMFHDHQPYEICVE